MVENTTKPKVIIYSTPTCTWCHTTKKFFKENKVDYVDKNVATDEIALKEMMEKTDGGTSVPVIDINGKIILGFDEPALKKALGIQDKS